jgi:hypothetical protein
MIARNLLLILLMLAVPMAGFASVTVQHCRIAATSAETHSQRHEMMASMPGMSAEDHAHMHHMAIQKSKSGDHLSSSCKCSTHCSGNCAFGSCVGSAAPPSYSLLLSELIGSTLNVSAISARTLTPPPLESLRPPIV